MWRLQSAASDSQHRTITARVVGLPHAPRRAGASRGNGAAQGLEILTASAAMRGSTNPHVIGKAMLVGGEADKAIEQLRKAAAKTQDAETLSDLAAALYTQAEQFGSHDSALDSLVAARKAVAASPTLAPAHFNLALALQYLGLTTEARSAFEQSAALERSSKWKDEALTRAAALREQKTDWTTVLRLVNAAKNEATRKAVVRQNLELARLHGEGPLLAAWAARRAEVPADTARETLALPRTIATVLRETHNDVYLTDAIAAIDRADARGQGLQMARALEKYGRGRAAIRARDQALAYTLLDETANELAELRSPVQYVARYFLAGVMYEQARINEAMKVHEALEEQHLEAKGYRGVAARLGWNYGICLLRRGSYVEALQRFDRSHAASTALGEEVLTAGLDANASQALEYLGDSREAWSRRARALRAYSLAATAEGTRTKSAALLAAANLQIAARNWERAEALLDYALESAIQTGYHLVAVPAFAQRSVARFEVGKIDEAEMDLGRARNRFRLITDEGVRKPLQAEINIATAVQRRVQSPQAAIAYLTDAINHSTSSGQSASLPRLYAERARAHGGGDVARRRKDLQAGLSVVASWERKIADEERRAATSVWGGAMRRDLITLELEAGDVAAAFSHADNRYTPANLATPLPLAKVQQALAPQAAILEYVTSGNRMKAFIIRSDSPTRVKTLPASVTRIVAAAKAMRDADDAQLPAAAANLHDLLLEPILKHLGGIATLAIVPDQELSGLSFSALRDAARDTYLLEHMAVVQSPSASAAITWSQRARALRDEKMLVIGASEFESEQYPGAAPLSQVEIEARNVARHYAGAQTLLGRQATPDAVRRALPLASMIHYAGHIVGRGADARLLLSRANGRDSLSAPEVGELSLDKTRIVILAACRGSGTSEPTAVVQDMASGFLKAGVPTVIASATDVADDKAPRTMQTLHKFLRNGGDGADALRSTARLERSQDKTSVPLSVRLLVMGGSRLLVR